MVSTVGFHVAIFISAIFFGKFLLSVTGFNIDSITDADASSDVDTTTDIPSSTVFGLSISDVLSLKGFLHFMFGFSWSWACFGLSSFYSAIAVFVGLLCVVLLAYLYKMISKLETESTNENKNNLIDRMGTVYLVYRDDDNNENKKYYKFLCQIPYNGKMSTLEMITTDEVKTGDMVIVREIKDNNVIVAFKA